MRPASVHSFIAGRHLVGLSIDSVSLSVALRQDHHNKGQQVRGRSEKSEKKRVSQALEPRSPHARTVSWHGTGGCASKATWLMRANGRQDEIVRVGQLKTPPGGNDSTGCESLVLLNY